MSLSRGEWTTLFLFLFALSLNAALMNDVIERKLGLCGDRFAEKPCEEDIQEEEHE